MEKRYYWLKLKEDFFRDLKIKKLRKIAGGDTYTIIYLKMQLLSLKNQGVLEYTKVENSFEEEIALAIDEDVENVAVTIAYLTQNGLLEEINESQFLLNGAVKCIGSETEVAARVRKCREMKDQNEAKMLQCNTNVTNCNKNVTLDIDIEKDIELDKEIEKKEINKEKKLTDAQEIQKIIDDNFKHNNELYEAYNEFNKMRSKNKKVSNTPYANRKIINELNKMTDDDEEKIAIINQSIINGWGGIFPVKKNNYNNSYNNNRPSTIAGASTSKSNFKVELPKMSDEELHKYDGMSDDDFNF